MASEKMKKVLIITRHFPPERSVAMLRLRGLGKYLPEFGWEPVFLTPMLPGQPDKRFRVIQTPYSGDIIKRLKKRLGFDPNRRVQEIVGVPFSQREGGRTFTNKVETYLRGIIFYPSKRRGWCPMAIKAGTKLLGEEKFDAIISSFSPVSAHLIGKELKSRFGIPWIADFRDLWTQNHYYRYGSVRKWFEERLELKTLSTADALVTVSKPWTEKIVRLHKGKDAFTITNGFDPEEVITSSLSKKFTISYTGKVYEGFQEPSLVFGAIRELIEEKKIIPEEVEVCLYDSKRYWLERMTKEYGLEGLVHQRGMISRVEVLSKQRESQVLLLLDWNEPNERGVYPGKVFEYLAARRPILATGGGAGVIKDLMEQTGAGIHSADAESVKEAVLSFYNEYKTNGEVGYKGSEEEINKYSQREMARKFSEVLNSIAE